MASDLGLHCLLRPVCPNPQDYSNILNRTKDGYYFCSLTVTGYRVFLVIHEHPAQTAWMTLCCSDRINTILPSMHLFLN